MINSPVFNEITNLPCMYSQLLWLEMALLSKKELHNIEKHS